MHVRCIRKVPKMRLEHARDASGMCTRQVRNVHEMHSEHAQDASGTCMRCIHVNAKSCDKVAARLNQLPCPFSPDMVCVQNACGMCERHILDMCKCYVPSILSCTVHACMSVIRSTNVSKFLNNAITVKLQWNYTVITQ